ncbi:MAG: YggT family protein [Candidatus Obscuribacter sp.]|jgi:YggT family protein|nr:YggT family protein [Candidatus Obscuribacter sp.]MBK7839101.1 YggT family protein [Candidatus Obscuribacter sp.]MBK9203287.1 YggT family protein [Candidatus Obscuribacter sp.]MBK9619391.1 YggT family protein [Candidatus Obscuribacter sp.]MBK9771780.1 YggT family protein [Candidatus Obscuribacter sp.]
MNAVLQILDGTIGLFTMLVFIKCLLSWFPGVNQYDQPFRLLNQIVNPVLDPVRRVIPPISGLDLSPMILIIGLQFIQRAIHMFL